MNKVLNGIVIRDFQRKDAERLHSIVREREIRRFMRDWAENAPAPEDFYEYIDWLQAKKNSTDVYENKRYAIPKDHEMSEHMIGVELCREESTVFRGGVFDQREYRWLYNEDGSVENLAFSATMSNGILLDQNGNVIDQMKPSVSAILGLMSSQELTHKGSWLSWFGGVLLCIVTVDSILFADELFRKNLAFQIRDADRAESSDLEIAGRYISWAVQPLAAMKVFVRGLQKIISFVVYLDFANKIRRSLI